MDKSFVFTLKGINLFPAFLIKFVSILISILNVKYFSEVFSNYYSGNSLLYFILLLILTLLLDSFFIFLVTDSFLKNIFINGRSMKFIGNIFILIIINIIMIIPYILSLFSFKILEAIFYIHIHQSQVWFVNVIYYFFFLVVMAFIVSLFLFLFFKFFFFQIDINGKKLSFSGNFIELFKIFLFKFIIPTSVIHLINNFLFSYIFVKLDIANTIFEYIMLIIFFIVIIGFFLNTVGCIVGWAINCHYDNNSIFLKSESSVHHVILKELYLTFITLFIYLPFALVNLYKVIIMNFMKSSKDESLIFEYNQTRGYSFVAKELFLSLITIGLYFPWAICKIVRSFLNDTRIK